MLKNFYEYSPFILTFHEVEFQRIQKFSIDKILFFISHVDLYIHGQIIDWFIDGLDFLL